MEFEEDKPIFRQVTDYCHRQVLSGAWVPEERVPSTKELAVTLTVNNRTVMKAYDELAGEGVIYQRRGMGYYACADAPERVREALRRQLRCEVAPRIADRLRLAGLSAAELLAAIEKYLPD